MIRWVVKRWWRGEYLRYNGFYERHWTSKMAHVLSDFWLAHWKFLTTAILTAAGLVLGFMKL